MVKRIYEHCGAGLNGDCLLRIFVCDVLKDKAEKVIRSQLDAIGLKDEPVNIVNESMPSKGQVICIAESRL